MKYILKFYNINYIVKNYLNKQVMSNLRQMWRQQIAKFTFHGDGTCTYYFIYYANYFKNIKIFLKVILK